MVQGLTEHYKYIELMVYRDSSLNIKGTQSTVRHMYLDNLSRINADERSIAGRGAEMKRSLNPTPT